MVRTWTEEVEEARRVIAPVLEEVDPHLRYRFDPTSGSEFEAVVIDIGGQKKQARVFVTFEAWVNAKADASEMTAAFSEVVHALSSAKAKDVIFVITSIGVMTKPRRTPTQRLLDEAALAEADVTVERFKRSLA